MSPLIVEVVDGLIKGEGRAGSLLLPRMEQHTLPQTHVQVQTRLIGRRQRTFLVQSMRLLQALSPQHAVIGSVYLFILAYTLKRKYPPIGPQLLNLTLPTNVPEPVPGNGG
jgi:hypothetical protein